MEKKVLTTDELQTLKNIQTDRNKIINDFGVLEYQIQDLQNQKSLLIRLMDDLREKEIQVGKELQAKYGEGNIDLISGEFTTIK